MVGRIAIVLIEHLIIVILGQEELTAYPLLYYICALVAVGECQVTLINSLPRLQAGEKWIPAFAGMTVWHKN